VVTLVLGLAAPILGLSFLSRVRPAVLARTAAAVLDGVCPTRAAAQEPMKFEPVPPESVTGLERGRSRKRRVEAVAPAPPGPPASAEPAEPPEPPEAPEPVTRVGDITRVGSDIHVENEESVQGTVMAWRGDVTVDGTVHGDVVAVGGNVNLNSTARVHGDVVCIGGELREEPGSYVSGEKVTIGGRGGESIARRIARRHRGIDLGDVETGWGALRLFGAFLRFAIAIGLTLLVAWIFQGRIAAGAEVMKRQPALSLGIGALVHALFIPSVVALAIVITMLCITIIGIPLALAAMFGYVLFFVVFWLLGLVVGATVLGEKALSRRGTPAQAVWQSALVGVVLVGGLRFVGGIFEAMGVIGLDGLGKVLVILSLLAAVVLGTVGGGAWLKWEFEAGLFGRWRRRLPGGRGAPAESGQPPTYGPPPGSPYGPPAVTPPPPPAAPAGTEAYMPPSPEPPSAPPGSAPGS